MDEYLIKQETDDDALDAYGRRRFIGVVGAAAAGVIITSNKADAGLFGFGNSSAPVSGIPESWGKVVH